MSGILVRDAINSDKYFIMDFCKNTFSWGDYVQYVWDFWISEGKLLVIEKQRPIGMCHGFLSKSQIWVEGVRIDPNFRRQGYASELIKHLESFAKEKLIPVSFMLIDDTNSSSLLMAKNLNYEIFQTWNFYSLLPSFNNHGRIRFGNVLNNANFMHYVKSWRWLVLDEETLFSLSKQNKIVFSDEFGEVSIAILTASEHFDRTLIVTLFSGSKNNTLNLISYIQNYGAENNYQKIQILTKENLDSLISLEFKIKFNLMRKFLC